MEKEETEKQPDMAEGQRRPRGMGYYQRSKAEELSPKASETVGMGGSPHSQQQVEDADLGEDWERVEHHYLEKLQVVFFFCSQLCVICLPVGERSACFLCACSSL